MWVGLLLGFRPKGLHDSLREVVETAKVVSSSLPEDFEPTGKFIVAGVFFNLGPALLVSGLGAVSTQARGRC
jgi:hypothetical protein